MIGVFKQQREGGKKVCLYPFYYYFSFVSEYLTLHFLKQLKFMTSITNIATPDGKKFTPNKVMLHNQG